MPITMGLDAEPISSQHFYELDYKVMKLFFSIHNEMGRLWNEKIYQNELAHRCKQVGFDNVNIEVPITVSYNDFVKVYYIDLLVNNAIYELKTATALNNVHEKQAINYLMLSGIKHGKLINFRTKSVQHRFVSTRIKPLDRFNFYINDSDWENLDEDSKWLKQIFTSLLKEWGLFLDISLFYEAIGYFRGGYENIYRELEVKTETHKLGLQKVHLLNPDIGFEISSVTKDAKNYEKHLRRLIQFTPLKAIQWINIDHHNVEFKTLIGK